MAFEMKDFYEKPSDFINLCTCAILDSPFHTRTAMGNGGILDTCHDVWIGIARAKPPPLNLAFSTVIYKKTHWEILRIGAKQRKKIPIDEEAPIPEESIERDLGERIDQKEIIKSLFAYLDGRSKQIIEMRFGLNGERCLTYEDCGKRLSVTKERVRQIESRALSKMRYHIRRFNYS